MIFFPYSFFSENSLYKDFQEADFLRELGRACRKSGFSIDFDYIYSDPKILAKALLLYWCISASWVDPSIFDYCPSANSALLMGFEILPEWNNFFNCDSYSLEQFQKDYSDFISSIP